MMTQARTLISTLASIRFCSFVAGVILFLVSLVRVSAQAAQQDSDDFGSAMQALVAAQQDALASGDPDRILNSSSPVAVASLALLDNLDRGDQESRKTIDAVSYAQSLLSDPSNELTLMKMELSLGESADAMNLKNHILSMNSEDPRLDLAVAEILEQGLQYGEAIPAAQRAIDLDPNSRDAQIALGMGYWGANVFQYNEDTLRAFSAAQRLDPNGYAPNLLLGRIESQYQQFDLAAQYLRTAADANPSAPEPWYHLGMNAYEQSRAADASEFLDHYISLAEASKDEKAAQVRLALLTLDEIAEEQGKARDAARQVEESSLKQKLLQGKDATGSNSGAEPLPMGAPDTRDQRPVPAKPTAVAGSTETIAQLRELAASALANIGTVFARRQDFARAVVPFRFAAEEDPTLEPLMRNYGLAACMSGMYEDSARALKSIVAAHPDDSAAQGCLGIAEFETGAYADAVANFTSLGPALASNPMFEATAAAAFARTGDREHAEQMLAGMKSANPDSQEKAREATAYFDLGELDRAIDSAEAAINGNSHAPGEALRVLGVIDLERGNAAKAVAEFQEECKADEQGKEKELVAEALLAEALMESGKKAEGEDLSGKVVHANPDLYKALLDQADNLLKNGDDQAYFEKSAAAFALEPHSKDARAAFDKAKQVVRASMH